MALKKQYRVFINEMIKHGDQVIAYKAAYPKASDESARVESYRILQIPTIAAAIKEQSEKITSIATQEAITELKDEIKATILTAERKKELLRQIAEGDLEIEVEKPVFDKRIGGFTTVTVTEKPNHLSRMKAIEVHNKMTGDFAPDKIESTEHIIFEEVAYDGNDPQED